MRIGKISYVNTLPFFYEWGPHPFEIVQNSPRALAGLAKSGQIDAAVLPIVECWGLEDSFEPVGSLGISVKKTTRSVFLLSKKNPTDLGGSSIGLTAQSSTSVILCQTILKRYFQIDARFHRGFLEADQARLVIGDEALLYAEKDSPEWPVRLDLATLWWEWKGLPFVFARWVVRKSIDSGQKKLLKELLSESLLRSRSHYATIVLEPSMRLGVSKEFLESYLQGFIYEYGPDATLSEKTFRGLAIDQASYLEPLEVVS